MKVSILIPVFNEQATIGLLIAKVVKAKLPIGFTKEVIIIDDGSTDATPRILNEAPSGLRPGYLLPVASSGAKSPRSETSSLSSTSLRWRFFAKGDKIKSRFKIIHHPRNLGKGAAIRTGIGFSTGEVVLVQDADLEYNPEDYGRLVVLFKDPKVLAVYGSRFINYPLVLFGTRKTPLPIHWLANKFLTFVTNILYGNSVTDMETCYKLVRRNTLLSLNLESNRFDIEPEITVKLLKKGIKINEISITVKPRSYREGKKIGWKDGLMAVFTLIKYRFRE